MNIELQKRHYDAMRGLLIGDALGVPYEFHAKEEIPPIGQIDFDPPVDFRRAHSTTPPGTWSDDGAQALALLDTIVSEPGFTPENFMENLVAWYRHGQYTPDGRVFDVGLTSRRAITAGAKGVDVAVTGGREEVDNGNGSLMRTLPAAFIGDRASIMKVAVQQSCVTHAHPRSQVACAIYCFMAEDMLNGTAGGTSIRDIFFNSIKTAREMVGNIYAYHREMDLIRDWGDTHKPSGSGYVVDCLWSAVQAIEDSTDFQSAVRNAIALGKDTDTTAAVAGGLAGIMYEIPEDMWAKVKGQAVVDSIFAKGGYNG